MSTGLDHIGCMSQGIIYDKRVRLCNVKVCCTREDAPLTEIDDLSQLNVHLYHQMRKLKCTRKHDQYKMKRMFRVFELRHKVQLILVNQLGMKSKLSCTYTDSTLKM